MTVTSVKLTGLDNRILSTIPQYPVAISRTGIAIAFGQDALYPNQIRRLERLVRLGLIDKQQDKIGISKTISMYSLRGEV